MWELCPILHQNATQATQNPISFTSSVYYLGVGNHSIGRLGKGTTDGPDIQVHGDLSISKTHATVIVFKASQPGSCLSAQVTDSSTYGTFVDGSKVNKGQTVPIHSGAIVRLALRAQFRLQVCQLVVYTRSISQLPKHIQALGAELGFEMTEQFKDEITHVFCNCGETISAAATAGLILGKHSIAYSWLELLASKKMWAGALPDTQEHVPTGLHVLCSRGSVPVDPLDLPGKLRRPLEGWTVVLALSSQIEDYAACVRAASADPVIYNTHHPPSASLLPLGKTILVSGAPTTDLILKKIPQISPEDFLACILLGDFSFVTAAIQAAHNMLPPAADPTVPMSIPETSEDLTQEAVASDLEDEVRQAPQRAVPHGQSTSLLEQAARPAATGRGLLGNAFFSLLNDDDDEDGGDLMAGRGVPTKTATAAAAAAPNVSSPRSLRSGAQKRGTESISNDKQVGVSPSQVGRKRLRQQEPEAHEAAVLESPSQPAGRSRRGARLIPSTSPGTFKTHGGLDAEPAQQNESDKRPGIPALELTRQTRTSGRVLDQHAATATQPTVSALESPRQTSVSGREAAQQLGTSGRGQFTAAVVSPRQTRASGKAPAQPPAAADAFASVQPSAVVPKAAQAAPASAVPTKTQVKADDDSAASTESVVFAPLIAVSAPGQTESRTGAKCFRKVWRSSNEAAGAGEPQARAVIKPSPSVIPLEVVDHFKDTKADAEAFLRDEKQRQLRRERADELFNSNLHGKRRR